MGEFLDLITPKEFFARLDTYTDLQPRGKKEIPFLESLDEITAGDIVSPVNLPAFSRSTVDGFALRAADSAGASETLPGYLTVIGEVLMGQEATMEVGPGEAVKIATGGMLPAGADAVMMVEYTEYLDDQTVEFHRAVAPGENVVLKGDDIKEGELLLKKGHLIRPQDIGALAGLGITEVGVYEKPEVAILSTGDELVSPYTNPGLGQIRDINSYSLAANLINLGCQVRNLGIVEDSYDKLRQAVVENLDCDLVLISGGSSVGVKDMTVDVLNSLGEPGVIVHGVSIKPGKPTILAVADGLPLIGLPGHPASAWTIFNTLVAPLVQVLRGETRELVLKTKGSGGTMQAVLTRNLGSDRGKEHYIPVRIIQDESQGYLAQPILGKSSLMTTLVEADGFLRIYTFVEGLDAGQKVEIQLF